MRKNQYSISLLLFIFHCSYYKIFIDHSITAQVTKSDTLSRTLIIKILPETDRTTTTNSNRPCLRVLEQVHSTLPFLVLHNCHHAQAQVCMWTQQFLRFPSADQHRILQIAHSQRTAALAVSSLCTAVPVTANTPNRIILALWFLFCPICFDQVLMTSFHQFLTCAKPYVVSTNKF